MNPSQIAAQIISWLKIAIVMMILVSLAAILLRAFGITIPLRTIGHIEIAYLAGAYWLVR